MDSNIPKDKYHTFALRTIAFKERLEFIEYYLKEHIKEPSLAYYRWCSRFMCRCKQHRKK